MDPFQDRCDAAVSRPNGPAPDVPPEVTPKNVWVLLGTIAGAKLGTLVVILWASHTLRSAVLIAVTIWPWFVIAGVLTAGPLLFRYRLRKVRARRKQLLRAEWTIEGSVDVVPATSSPRVEGV